MPAVDDQVLEVPRDVMVPVVQKVVRDSGRGVDSLTTEDIERIKALCGPSYGHMPLDYFRLTAINHRKKGLIGKVLGGVGPPKKSEYSQEYIDRINSPDWSAYRNKLLEIWGHCCAICNSDKGLEIHHRHYATLGHESWTDCIPLCKKCHKVADVRRQKEAQATKSKELF